MAIKYINCAVRASPNPHAKNIFGVIITDNMNISYHTLTPDRWRDVDGLFGPKEGARAAGAFKKAGFKEVARRSSTRPIMRYEV